MDQETFERIQKEVIMDTTPGLWQQVALNSILMRPGIGNITFDSPSGPNPTGELRRGMVIKPSFRNKNKADWLKVLNVFFKRGTRGKIAD